MAGLIVQSPIPAQVLQGGSCYHRNSHVPTSETHALTDCLTYFALLPYCVGCGPQSQQPRTYIHSTPSFAFRPLASNLLEMLHDNETREMRPGGPSEESLSSPPIARPTASTGFRSSPTMPRAIRRWTPMNNRRHAKLECAGGRLSIYIKRDVL